MNYIQTIAKARAMRLTADIIDDICNNKAPLIWSDQQGAMILLEVKQEYEPAFLDAVCIEDGFENLEKILIDWLENDVYTVQPITFDSWVVLQNAGIPWADDTIYINEVWGCDVLFNWGDIIFKKTQLEGCLLNPKYDWEEEGA